VAASAAGPAAAAPAAPAEGLHLQSYTYEDQQGLGGPVLRMLMPAGWIFEGGVTWSMQVPAMPGVVGFRVRNPHGLEVLEAFPPMAFVWSNNPMMGFGGMGMPGYEPLAPGPAGQVLQQVVLPRVRGHVQGLQFVSQQPLLGLPGQAPDPFTGAPTTWEGAKLRVRYREGEAAIEEEIYGVVEVTHAAMPTMMGMMQTLFWQAGYLFSFRAQEGRFDALSTLFETIVRSFQVDLGWFSRYTQVAQYLVQNAMMGMPSIQQLRQLASQIGNAVPQPVMALYQRQHEIRQQMANGIGHAARGSAVYQNPLSHTTVELPAGYGFAWTSSEGEYVLTDDSHFDPRQGTRADWQPLSRL
jgi:hypothetical protein